MKAAVLLAALVLAGCEGVVIVEDDEGPPSPGPFLCPLEETPECPSGDGIPSPVIVLVDAGGTGGGTP